MYNALCNKKEVHKHAKHLYENYASIKNSQVQEENDIFDKLDDLVLGNLKLLPNDNIKIMEKIKEEIHKKFVVKKANRVNMDTEEG